ncbi:hypothetical protein [Rhizobium ruizarguesonis]|uniref:hypothetical protein n=1 Tax=Rhizobium ruizarguesonis TaxID=2081791 RepID=UPI0013DF0B86|nr:hypothetical protein [Rhizobium ruizarguesonis]NEJ94328.1 hypothetical protein [Rhizobium ruizarguesonis]
MRRLARLYLDGRAPMAVSMNTISGRINAINEIAKGMAFELFRKKAILRYGTLISLSGLTGLEVPSEEKDHTRRPHSSLDRQTPDQAYFNALTPMIAAA